MREHQGLLGDRPPGSLFSVTPQYLTSSAKWEHTANGDTALGNVSSCYYCSHNNDVVEGLDSRARLPEFNFHSVLPLAN